MQQQHVLAETQFITVGQVQSTGVTVLSFIFSSSIGRYFNNAIYFLLPEL